MTDLAWFPFFIDAWLGGTISMSQAELGAYLQALIAQWKSGAIQAIKDTPKSIYATCRGKMSAQVRAKFESVEIEGELYLRNLRLCEIYSEQMDKHRLRVERAKKGAQAKHKQTTSSASSIQKKEERREKSIEVGSLIDCSPLNEKENTGSKSHSRKRATKPPKVVDVRKDHPAIVAVRELIERYPDKLLWDRIIALVGPEPDKPRMAECLVAWLQVSGNRYNYEQWLFDWYPHGIPRKVGRPNGGDKVARILAVGDEFVERNQVWTEKPT